MASGKLLLTPNVVACLRFYTDCSLRVYTGQRILLGKPPGEERDSRLVATAVRRIRVSAYSVRFGQCGLAACVFSKLELRFELRALCRAIYAFQTTVAVSKLISWCVGGSRNFRFSLSRN